MGAYVQAGVDLYRSTLRYAEVERDGSNYRLLKLGSCEFDFDMAQVLLNGAQPVYLDTLAEALNDVFSQSKAAELHVVFHPSNCYSFFTPLFVDMTEEERKWRLQEEANLLTSEGVPMPLHLTADVVYTETLENGRVVEWFHVLAIEELVHSQLDRILQTLPPASYRFNLSTRGTANAIESMARKENREAPGEAPFTLGIGYYGGHIEYVLCRKNRWFFSHHSESSAAVDSVYFALGLLRRLNLERASVGQVYIYGDEIEADVFTLLQDVFHLTPEVLNPVEVVSLDRKSSGMHFTAEAYVPCIGIAM
jgi:hypothetical protein